MYLTNYELLKRECENWKKKKKKSLNQGKKVEMCFNFSFLW